MQKVIIGAGFVLLALLLTLATGIGPGPALADAGDYITDAREVEALLNRDNVVLVDMRSADDYAGGHVAGAVNIPRSAVVVNEPYPNLLAPQEQIEQVLSESGIDNNTMVIIYDDSKNMDAARLWWTLLVYGHENARVVSGGFAALRQAGFSLSTEPPRQQQKEFRAAGPNPDYIATLDDILPQVENPDDNVILLDTRSREEFNEGTIPGSVLVNFELNNFDDGTYRPVQHILLEYKERGITADREIIIFCAVSVRGAQTFLALYNAGYRNLRLYDAAWVEYSDRLDPACDGADPVEAEDEEEEEPLEEVEAPGG